ncbi:iron(III) transport system substrate-binding protein [Pseudonocardia thermophila]|uniref:Iron(III) transport system substrate-binding protein n=1 Tax=Pseudonocardia thermophila TaxID=1848 RepID=A0A1M7BAJ6_PSETH|nr:extracellular solute-binding protein [Pseudonocardia thermophila]SHL51961.1 iron(III) transport system substrate-binding protein [Pseudonocardia thermophila]
MPQVFRPRRLFAFAASLALLLGLLGCSSGSAASQEAAADVPPEYAQLYAAARAEGRVKVYMVLVPPVVEALKKGFEQKYPGVTLDAVRLTDPEMLPRVDAELGTEQGTADLLLNTSVAWLRKHGAQNAWAAADRSPLANGASGYDPEAWFDATHKMYEVGAALITFAWNTDLVPGGIRDYPDLLDPALKGKLGVNQLSSGQATDFYTWLEQTFGTEYYEGLAAMNPRIYEATAPIVAALGAGEIAAANWASPQLVEDARKKGAPIDYALSPKGSFAARGFAVLNAKAKAPNAAQLFLDYLLSAEGQRIAWQHGSSVLNPPPEGVLTTQDKLAPMNPYGTSGDEIAAAQQRFDALFR